MPAFTDRPNSSATSANGGGVNYSLDMGFLTIALKEIGSHRVIFGTDGVSSSRGFGSQIAKIISEVDPTIIRRQIFYKNIAKIIKLSI